MTQPTTPTEESAIEIARRFIAPRLRAGRSFSITARRVDRQAIDEHAAQIQYVRGDGSDTQSVLASLGLDREHWVVCFFPSDEEPESASTEHPAVVLVYDSGEVRLDDV